MSRKFNNIGRIVNNAEMLSVPEISDMFFYGGCEDMDGLDDIVEEIDELEDCLPEGTDLLDLPDTFCGNKKTKVYGVATCRATEGHQIVNNNAPNRIIFEDSEEAEKLGYRPCKRCMPEAYIKWQKERGIYGNA